jgi:hexokinase
MPPHRLSLAEALQDVEKQFELTTDDLNAILKRFRQQMELGLAENGQDMAMIPSFGKYQAERPSQQWKMGS